MHFFYFFTLVLEVATAEYGDFIPQLSKAATDDRWRLSATSFLTEPVRSQIEQFQLDTVKSQVSRINSSESHDIYDVPSEWRKFLVLLKRCNIHYYRDWVNIYKFIYRVFLFIKFFIQQTVTHFKLLFHVLTAILVGLMYGDSGVNATKTIANIGLFLIGISYLWYTTMMPSVLKCKLTRPYFLHIAFSVNNIFFFILVPSEIAIIKKETFNNWYKLRTYFLANMITTAPIHVSNRKLYIKIVLQLLNL